MDPIRRPPAPVRFGLDIYSLNQQNWIPFQHLDFAAKWKLQVVIALCDNGQPSMAAAPEPEKTPAERQLADVEPSLKWTQTFLANLGLNS